AAGDDAGSRSRRLEQHGRRTDLKANFVRNRLFDHRHGYQTLLRRFDRLADRLGNFARFADGKTDFSLAIADDDQRAKAEAFAALDDFRNAVHAYDGLFES